uniref:Family with sequence similarity 210 member B n=1 Tax=Neovison vison TaxID=452646 RepID=A0A8C7BWU0_NEOVI
MAGLLALLGPAGRVGARVRLRASWLLGAAAPCAPRPLLLPLLRPGPDAQLLRAVGGDSRGRQVSLPTPIPALGRPDPGPSPAKDAHYSKCHLLEKIHRPWGLGAGAGISPVSCSCGVDMSAILLKLGFKESLVQSKMAAGTSTFVVAYAIHKLFAPVRISITLVSVPFIVRYFRKVGFFKPPAAKP